jgi:hypothetical protein
LSDAIQQAIEKVREELRHRVALSSLRRVATEIGISHTALAGFVRDEGPREPYGIGRRRLLEWGVRHGVLDKEQLSGPSPWRPLAAAVAEAASEYGRRPALTEEGLRQIRVHLRALSEAGLDEYRLFAVEDLLRKNPFEALRASPAGAQGRDEIGDINRAFRYIADVLSDEGFAISLEESDPTDRSPEELSRAFDEGEAEAELLARVQRQRPEPKPKPQGKKRRA